MAGIQRRARNSRSAHDDETCEAGKQLGLVPARHVAVLVRPDDEVEPGTGVEPPQPGERVDRERRPRPLFLDPAQLKSSFSGNGDSHHRQTMAVLSDRATLVRRSVGGNEEDSVKP